MPPARPFARLVVARRLSGMSQASLAAALQVSRAWVCQVEAGDAVANPERLAQMARELQVSTSFLVDDEFVPLDPSDCFFRSLGSTLTSSRERALGSCDVLRLLLREMEDQVTRAYGPASLPMAAHGWSDAASDLDDLFHPSIEGIAASCNPQAEAARARAEFGLDPAEPVEDMVRLLEAQGVVLHTVPDFSADTIDAFSFWVDDRPVVMLNHQKKDPFRSRYDAAHELGHLLVHRGLPARRESSGRSPRGPDPVIEGQANEFAGAFLVPGAAWMAEAPRSTNPYAYLPGKRRWRVSVAALIVRSARLKLLTEAQYRSAMTRYGQLGWRAGEPEGESMPHEMPGALPVALGLFERSGPHSAVRLLREWGVVGMNAAFDYLADARNGRVVLLNGARRGQALSGPAPIPSATRLDTVEDRPNYRADLIPLGRAGGGGGQVVAFRGRGR